MKSIEDLEKEYEQAILMGHPHLQAQASAMQRVIALTLIEILREIRAIPDFLVSSPGLEFKKVETKGRHK